MFEELEIPDK